MKYSKFYPKVKYDQVKYDQVKYENIQENKYLI